MGGRPMNREVSMTPTNQVEELARQLAEERSEWEATHEVDTSGMTVVSTITRKETP